MTEIVYIEVQKLRRSSFITKWSRARNNSTSSAETQVRHHMVHQGLWKGTKIHYTSLGLSGLQVFSFFSSCILLKDNELSKTRRIEKKREHRLLMSLKRHGLLPTESQTLGILLYNLQVCHPLGTTQFLLSQSIKPLTDTTRTVLLTSHHKLQWVRWRWKIWGATKSSAHAPR